MEGLKKEFCALGWKLIEWKVAYYRPEAVHESRRADYEVSDETYDAAEVRYLTLCRKLQEVNAKDPLYADCGPYPLNSVVHKGWPGFEDLVGPHTMMEVDEDRPSVQLVMAKLGSPKRRYRRSITGSR